MGSNIKNSGGSTIKKSVSSCSRSSQRILLVDDHVLFRSGLRMLLIAGNVTAEIIEAGSVNEAMHAISLPIDAVLLDIQLPGLSGLEGITVLKKHLPKTPIILLSGQADTATVQKTELLGAAGFVSKAAAAEEIFLALAEVLAGRTFFPPALAATHFAHNKVVAAAPLTARQLEVLEQLCLGLSNKLIARKLGIAENTVQTHVAAVFGYLGVTNRASALLAAQALGIVR